MPFPENPKQRGDLIMKFNIEFPIYLPSFSKNHIKKAFEMSNTNVENTEYIHRFILDNKMRRNIDDNIPLRRGANDEADRLKFICETWFRICFLQMYFAFYLIRILTRYNLYILTS